MLFLDLYWSFQNLPFPHLYCKANSVLSPLCDSFIYQLLFTELQNPSISEVRPWEPTSVSSPSKMRPKLRVKWLAQSHRVEIQSIRFTGWNEIQSLTQICAKIYLFTYLYSNKIINNSRFLFKDTWINTFKFFLIKKSIAIIEWVG